MPWQDTANLDVSQPPLGEASITPTGETGPDATATPRQSSSRAGAMPDVDEPSPELATLAPRTALGSPQKETSLPADRLVLARELQRELARVGCYEGEFSGVWTPTARKAMKAFVDRVNATLPTEEPDYILLTLVQSARDKVCGASCPPGQGLAESRCMPSAILAGKKAAQVTRVSPVRPDPAAAITGWSVTQTTTAATPASSPDAERMGLAGPSAQRSPGAATAPAASRQADARRARAQPSGFGVGMFKQLLGF